MREITRICDKAGIVCGTGTAAMMPDFFERWGERDTAYMMCGVGRAAFAGWQAWNLAFGDSVSNQRIAEVERMLRNGMAFKWFSIQRVGGRVMFIMTLRVARKAYNVAPPNSGPEPTPTSDEWLWFQIPSGGTVTLTRTGSPTTVTLEVSLDNGSTWTTWTESGTTRTQTLSAGQVMHVRNASPTSTGLSIGGSAFYTFSFSASAKAGGNCDSMLCQDPSNAVISQYCYYSLFENATIVTPPQLPSTTMTNFCYHSMFRGSTIEKSPLLPAKTLASRCYRYMFSNCTSLNEVRTEMEDISANQCTFSWLNNVAGSGDFYCPQSLTITTGDASGIPAGWTRHDL